jgi:hypothetical protein
MLAVPRTQTRDGEHQLPTALNNLIGFVKFSFILTAAATSSR